MSLWTLLEARKKSSPSKPFLIWQPFDQPETSISYAAFTDSALALAGWLSVHGVHEGSRLLVHLDNCPEYLVALFACARLGATAVTTNTRLAKDELADIAASVSPVIVLTQPKYFGTVCAAVGACRAMIVTGSDGGAAPIDNISFSREILRYDDCVSAAGDVPQHVPATSRDLLIQFTSGTTARAKGVVLTHANLLWAGRLSAYHEGLRTDDIHLVSLPLFHVNALNYSIMATLWVGASAVLLPRFSSRRYWDIALRHKCTWASQTGFTHKALLGGFIPKSHAFRFWGNGVCDIEEDKTTGIRTLGWWGMTETVTHGIVGLTDLPNRPWSMGRPSPGYGVAVVDEDGQPSAFEMPGNLRIDGVRGLSLFDRYLDDEAGTINAFDEAGRFITGDVVIQHGDGFISFVERAKDMLKVGGENVAASEIERVIAAVAGVCDVSVVGQPHAMLDEVPVAFVVPASGMDADILSKSIARQCTSMLADFKRPHAVHFIDALPTGTLDKVSKKDLRAMLPA